MLLLRSAFQICNTHGLTPRIRASTLCGARWIATHDKNLDVNHAHFIAEASPKARWTEDDTPEKSKLKASWNDVAGVAEGRGKLSPTSSHLFKLILPLGNLPNPSNNEQSHPNVTSADPPPPMVFLLHPSQPLSHIGRLIHAELGHTTSHISFRSAPADGKAVQWSDSTDLGDFIRAAARSAEFTIAITHERNHRHGRGLPHAREEDEDGDAAGMKETLLTVAVPTFADRTRFMQRRLRLVGSLLHEMEGLKERCDAEARQGARHMALGGFGILVVYWGAVARLTFWDYGWDVMEPITYLSGLSTVVVGYLWFLYQGREVSYSSVLARSITARREALYKTRGLGIERWSELISERKALRSEIARIARDYEDDDDDDIPAEFHARDKDVGDNASNAALEDDSDDVAARAKDSDDSPEDSDNSFDKEDDEGKNKNKSRKKDKDVEF